MKDQKHAEMLNAYAKWYRGTYKGNGYDVELEIEVPFNHYGERGFIDLLAKRIVPLRDSTRKIVDIDIFYDLCELKTHIDDLGETIRQVKRAKEFFPLTRGLLKSHCFAWLVLLETHENRCCVTENEELFKVARIDEVRFFRPSTNSVRTAISLISQRLAVAPSRRVEGG